MDSGNKEIIIFFSIIIAIMGAVSLHIAVKVGYEKVYMLGYNDGKSDLVEQMRLDLATNGVTPQVFRLENGTRVGVNLIVQPSQQAVDQLMATGYAAGRNSVANDLINSFSQFGYADVNFTVQGQLVPARLVPQRIEGQPTQQLATQQASGVAQPQQQQATGGSDIQQAV